MEVFYEQLFTGITGLDKKEFCINRLYIHEVYTIGYDRSLYIDDEAERLIPDTEKSKDIVLFKYERKSKDWLSGKSIPVEGIEYYKSFNDIDEMLDDDWVAD